MSIFELMAHYIPHRDFRVRLAMNGAAANIYGCWVLSLGGLITALILLLRAHFLNAAICLGAGAALFAFSFLFLSEAKRLHEIKRIMENEVLFDKQAHDN